MGVQEHVEAIAHLVGVAVPVFTSFIGHRQLTFRRSAE
jgi:putative flippase GtrA